MTEEAEQDEERIIEVLEAAGWKKTDQGRALGTASLFYDNGMMSLQVEQEFGETELILSLTAPNGLTQVLFISYDDSLESVLSVITGFQNEINPDNFRDKIRQLVNTNCAVYVQDEEDEEPKLLTPD